MVFGNAAFEWDEEVSLLVEQLEEESDSREFSREEQALLDIVEAVQLILDGEGLHDFWHSGLNHRRVINSFDLVGASSMVDLLNASQWCQTRDEDSAQYSEVETNHLADIEQDLEDVLGELEEQVAEFVEDELS